MSNAISIGDIYNYGVKSPGTLISSGLVVPYLTVQVTFSAAVVAGEMLRSNYALDASVPGEAVSFAGWQKTLGAGHIDWGFRGIAEASRAATSVGTLVLQGLCNALVNGNSANIAAGDPLTHKTAGRLEKAATGECVWAIAREAATTDNASIEVVLFATPIGTAP